MKEQKRQTNLLNVKTRTLEASRRSESLMEPRNIQTQMKALSQTFSQFKSQNRRLNDLYAATRNRNQELIVINSKFNKDLLFLAEYCQLLQKEIEQCHCQQRSKSILSRKQTAEDIFSAYQQSSLMLTQDTISKECLLPQTLYTQRPQQIQCAAVASQTEPLLQPSHWHQAYQSSQKRVLSLEREVKQLRKINEGLQTQRKRKQMKSLAWQQRGQLFSDVHRLMQEYKNKINALAHQKKEIQKKFKQLKDRLNRMGQNNEGRLLDLQSEKVLILQRLTEKQQKQIQNTIQMYQVQLQKIQVRRKEEIESYQNDRFEMQGQILALQMKFQKALNARDDYALELRQTKSQMQALIQKNAVLQQENDRKRGRHFKICRSVTFASTLRVRQRELRTHHTLNMTVIFNNKPNMEMHHTIQHIILPTIVPQYVSSNSLNMDLNNIAIQLPPQIKKEVAGVQTERKFEIYTERRYQKSPPKINIKYMDSAYFVNSKYMGSRIRREYQPPNKSYDEVLQYKRRFIQRKTDLSFNH